MVNLVTKSISSGEKPSRRLSVSLKRTQEQIQEQSITSFTNKDEQTSPPEKNKSKKPIHKNKSKKEEVTTPKSSYIWK